MKISEGKKKTPVKMVIYGSEGIGKSTLASHFPEALFIDIENGTNQLDVKRVDEPVKTWEQLRDILNEIEKDPCICRTLVIDTIDAAEELAIDFICDKHRKSGIEEFGYGKGYVYIKEEIQKLLKKLNELVEKNAVNIVLIAHSKMRKFEQPDEVGAYDRYELKLTKNVSPVVKEWADVVLFLNYKTVVVNAGDDKTKNYKATGGKRVIYTSHNPVWDAKNRYGLDDELPLEYASIEPIFNASVDDKDQISFEFTEEEIDSILDDPDFTLIEEPEIPQALKDLMERDNISEEVIIKASALKGKCKEVNEATGQPTKISDLDESFVQSMLIDRWDKFKGFLEKNKKKGLI